MNISQSLGHPHTVTLFRFLSMRQPINKHRVSRDTKTVEESTVSAILRLSLLPNDWGMRFGDGVRSLPG